MAFPIEIIATEKELVSSLRAAIEPLNKVQEEFFFRLANDDLMKQAFAFRQQAYTNMQVYEWLKSYRAKAGGNRPYIILVLNKPLSGKLPNLYGGHRASEGFAWFTTEMFEKRSSTQFLFDKIRFCRYYLVRYILSFVNSSIKSHPTETCMFDDKIDKRDIKLSLNSGIICDECVRQLRSSALYNADVGSSINNLLAVVSNQYPRALVLKGGGAKGLALVGALKELEKYFTFDTFAGTSAGAIAATLLGAGYKPGELEDIFKKKDFRDFKDNILKVCWNLVIKTAMHGGKHFRDWLDDLLSVKLSHLVDKVRMENLPKRAIVYASQAGGGVLRFDKLGGRSNTYAAFATRCSMSIPYFFIPEKVDGIKVYDGGLGNNFPLKTFISDNGNALFIGLYLISEVKQNGSTLSDLLDIATDANEREVVQQHPDKIVIIDPRPIKTTQFKLSEQDKNFLLQAGKVGALVYLNRYHGDFQISDETVASEKAKLEELRSKLGKKEKKVKDKDKSAQENEAGNSET